MRTVAVCVVNTLQNKSKMCQGRCYWAVVNLQNHELESTSVEWNIR